MKPRKLKIEDVTVTLRAEPEEIPIKGSFATGDDAGDRAIEQDIQQRLKNDDEWAWFCAAVEVRWGDYSATEYLGCCSYDSEQDFRASDYFDDMVNAALDELNNQVQEAYADLAEILEPAT